MKLVQNKREVQLNNMRKEIAQFLQNGEEAIARIRVEHVIRELNIWDAYEILELFCEFVLARVPILDSQRECPPELKEAIASIIFAAPRCSDLPELLQIQSLFAAKYGKEFISAAAELRPDTSVNRAIIEKLSVRAPSAEEKLSLLKEIAQKYNLEWDPSSTKAEFSKHHEDLLDGSKKIRNQTAESQSTTGSYVNSSRRNEAHTVTSTNQNQGIQHLQATPLLASKKTLVDSVKTEHLVTNTTGDTRKDTNSDILEKARAAIASAERASAAARAAAKLVKVKSGV
ncbi:protein of unknown function DUF292 [Macleaya cordata]|uniref:Regulator of Vps4 activity in the MVB pathway n=1 Tax=Macleaya cordata TaxID=56857 RepID=A0A200QM55_MACCD|nr:protein of unknown function DUF292 [Macleaya cordata]